MKIMKECLGLIQAISRRGQQRHQSSIYLFVFLLFFPIPIDSEIYINIHDTETLFSSRDFFVFFPPFLRLLSAFSGLFIGLPWFQPELVFNFVDEVNKTDI